MPTEMLWKSMNMLETFPPLLATCLGDCFYARDYSSGQGYGASDCNQLINNFKKPPDRRANPYEWRHKDRAIRQFADELGEILENGDVIAFMPTSKRRDHAEYDDRFDQVGGLLKQALPGLIIVEPIVRHVSLTPVHLGGIRTVAAITESLQYSGFEPGEDNNLIIIDDVVAAGTHFTAYKNILKRRHPTLELSGVFWARAIRPA